MDSNLVTRPRIITLVLGLAAFAIPTLFMAACNTMEGVGRDVASVGNSLSGAAGDTQQAMFKEE